MPTFTGPAFCGAIPTLDPYGVPVAPAQVAHTLQRTLSELISQGYEVVGVTPIAGAVLLTAVRREPPPLGRQRFYGCEGLTCQPGAHTLDCPNIDLDHG